MSKKDIRSGYWKEKWNYSPHFIGNINEDTKKDYSIAKIIKIHNVSSLTWTPLEEKIIRAIVNAGNNLFKINNFNQIRVFDRQIIILDDAVYKDRVKMSENEGGSCSFGYVYVRRRENLCDFIIDLAHELSHLFSFYSLSIKEDNKNKKRFINFHKLGFHLSDEEDKVSFYFGINEAATDIWSKAILSEVIRTGFLNDFLDKEKKDFILHNFAYDLHVKLIEEIVLNKIEGSSFYFIKSYFDGSNDFCEFLEKKNPGVLPVLKNMDNTRESVINVAHEVGGEKLKDKILTEY
jgi:hypothetical protein